MTEQKTGDSGSDLIVFAKTVGSSWHVRATAPNFHFEENGCTLLVEPHGAKRRSLRRAYREYAEYRKTVAA